MSNIIGLGGSLHDFSACLINDDNEIIAIEDERINRKRYSLGEPKPHTKSVEYCLKYSGININEVDHIVGDDMISDLFYPEKETLNHHLAHAYSGFFTSNFKDSAILVLDGVGSLTGNGEERETTTYAYGVNDVVNIIGKVFGTPSSFRRSPSMPRFRSNSLGELYRLVTEMIDFGFLQAGKTMGLYSYGDDRYVEDFSKYVVLSNYGQYQINVDGEEGLVKKILKIKSENNDKNTFSLDSCLAYAAQITLETIVTHCLDYLWTRTKCQNLCIVGGVGLNSALNGKLTQISKFKNIHITSAPGDNGAAIGAAIYGKLLLNNLRHDTITRFSCSPYLGKEYSDEQVRQAIGTLPYHVCKTANLSAYVAEHLSKGLIVACFQGKSEFGPRALGNRSILADPRNPHMKDRLNKIKGREWFRPVAPAVIDKYVSYYFDANHSSPYMQYVFAVKNNFIDSIKSAVHIDETARVQTLHQELNPFFYDVVERFGDITNIPIVINTSFNIGGQPIVETPKEAVETFINSEIDLLVINEFILKK